MTDDVKIQDVFSSTSIEELQAKMDDLSRTFSVHDHDGRNSLEVNTAANARAVRLLSLAPMSDKSDGSVEITGATTLERDMFYDRLTVKSGGVLTSASFRIFADIVEIQGGGIIKNNGNDGENGDNGVLNGPLAFGGSGGAAVSAGSLPEGKSGSAGGNGGANGIADPTDGTAGSDAAKALGAAGAAGGRGGAWDSGYDSDGGVAGGKTGTVFNIPRSQTAAYGLFDTQPSGAFAPLTVSAGSGGGGGGSTGEGFERGGGGGGGGSPGGCVAIFARQIINSGTIQAIGGNGGAGGNGKADDAGAGGGGGGGGGSGGVIILVYGDLSGTGVLEVSAGVGGAGGAGDSGVGGEAGSDGLEGSIYSIQVSSL